MRILKVIYALAVLLLGGLAGAVGTVHADAFGFFYNAGIVWGSGLLIWVAARGISKLFPPRIGPDQASRPAPPPKPRRP
jgi:hypothetical protein